jgi:predicted O-methyltransferase YrrM
VVRVRRRTRVPSRPDPARSHRFREEAHDRFWWHRLAATDYVPPLYGCLAEDEWAVMEGWFAETGREGRIAEINVPAMALVSGLVSGNGVRRVVQLGHYYGYSALLLGFALRRMGLETPGLFTVDLDGAATDFTRRWIGKAGLDGVVAVVEGDSADPAMPARAREALGGAPEVVLVDSSHAYAHTLIELDLWAGELPPGGLILLHDASVFAQQFDPSGEGGVHRAIGEWLARSPGWTGMTLNGSVAPGADGDALVYKDACGLGILQRAFTPPPDPGSSSPPPGDMRSTADET